jgi:VIT1/CCC1 family predicted Fe2+/Mn2+ transporter
MEDTAKVSADAVRSLPEEIRQKIRMAQQIELTEYHIYRKLAASQKDPDMRTLLERIANEELEHHDFWKELLGESVRPRRLQIVFYTALARIFGITFGIKLMEKGEQRAEKTYGELLQYIPQVQELIEAEDRHEQHLISLLDEERLRYVSSMVLGLNDALVELTGALAGLTLALQNTHIVALAGLITGIAAALSMAASEYLSTKSEEGEKNPLKAAGYTGVAYIFTVLFLVFPYFVLANPFFSLGWAVANALLVIFFFTYYISVAKDLSFRHRFGEMALISIGVMLINFLIGLVIRHFFHIDV